MKTKTLRSKLVRIISFFIILIFAITGFVLVDRQSKELTVDIYRNALNFAKLTNGRIVDDYRLYYESQGFSYFNRDMTDIFTLNNDISGISLVSYDGEILYESQTEKNLQYSGAKRQVSDTGLLERVQDVKTSLLTQGGRVLYVKEKEDGTVSYVDKNDKPVPALSDTERIASVVTRYDDTYRLVYYVTYANLDGRIQAMVISIAILLLIAAVSGIIVSTTFASRIVNPIKKLMQGAVEIGKGNLNVQVEVHTKDELKLLADTFNTMTADLRKSTEALVEKERIGKELEIARKIQMDLLPKKIHLKGLEIAAGLVPAAEIGGDCFDFIEMADHTYLLYIGDVTGHGVPSGLVVAMANSLIYSYSGLFVSPKEILAQTNKIIKSKTAPDMFITMLMGTWNSQNNTFLYTQAGHDPIFHYRAASGALEMGVKGGLALGLLPDISKSMKEEKLALQTGDVLVLYTDGFPEAWRNGGGGKREIMGFKRFSDIVKAAMQEPTAQLIYDKIVSDAKEYMGDYPQADDMTLIVMKKI